MKHFKAVPMTEKTILLIEAFYGGSHKQLIDLIYKSFSDSAQLFSLPAKKWHWRALTSPLHFAEVIPTEHKFSLLFSSSVLPLAELLALRPDLSKLYKVVYFHENQMVYPVQQKKDRYFQHAYNEVLTCLAADKVVFNSNFNKESFLTSISSHFKIMPEPRPKNIESKIRPKCLVLYFPIDFSCVCIAQKKLHNENEKIPNLTHDMDSKPGICMSDETNKTNDLVTTENTSIKSPVSSDILHIVWPHRWEHDKNPEEFFTVMFQLKEAGIPFNLSVIGESYSEKPDIFAKAADYLKENIIHFGFKESKEEYYAVLSSADVVVSTALHEFFGVSMLEASACGCFPLCPRRLVYPEIYPEECLYNTTNQLFKKLKYFCQRPWVVRNSKLKVNFGKFTWDNLCKEYMKLLEEKPRHT